MCAENSSFFPKNFQVPLQLETPRFKFRILTVDDVIRDYGAVMLSVAHLRTIWPD